MSVTADRRPFDLWTAADDADRFIGRVSQAWRDEIMRDCNLTRAFMVVELILGNGKRLRIATEELASITEAGTIRDAVGVLLAEATVTNNYDIDNASSQSRTMAVECPAPFIRPQDQIQDGFPLAGFGEVALLLDNMEWRDRRVILRGDMSGGVSFGAVRNRAVDWQGGRTPDNVEGEVFRCQLQDPRESANPAFPPWIVDLQSFPLAHDSAIGKPYPIVYGRFTVQGLRVFSNAIQPRFVVAYGHGHSVGTIWRNDEDETASFTVIKDNDENGVPYTSVQANFAAFVWEDGDTVFAEVTPLDPDEPDPDILTVMEDLILRFHPGGADVINRQLFGDAGAKTGAVRRIRTAINTQTTLLNYIEEGLLDDFPMLAMVWQGGRYGPILTDFRAEPRVQLVLGTRLLRFRMGDVSESPKGDVFNSYTLRYDFDHQLDEFLQVRTVTADDNAAAAVSAQSQGVRVAPVEEAVNVREVQTANWILDWLVSHRTLPTYFVEYGGAACLFFLLRRGDTVELTDPDLEYFSVKATVERLIYQRGLVRLGLRVWQNPLRETGRWPAS